MSAIYDLKLSKSGKNNTLANNCYSRYVLKSQILPHLLLDIKQLEICLGLKIIKLSSNSYTDLVRIVLKIYTLEGFDKDGNYTRTPSITFHVQDEFTIKKNSDGASTKISAHKIPAIHQDIFNIKTSGSSNDIFSKTELILQNKILRNL